MSDVLDMGLPYPLRWAIYSLRRRGVSQTMEVVGSYAADLLFDWRHGTDTVSRVEMRELRIASDNKAHACRYGATKAQPFRRLIDRLDLPRDTTFVDIGSGKGRVLMLAAECGFRKVVGIDFSPELCAKARENIAIWRRRVPDAAPIDIIESDAAAYPFTPDQQVFYLFHPFNAQVLRRVVENLGRSLTASARKAWLIYLTPQFHDEICHSSAFPRWTHHEISGSDFRVYTNH